MKKTIAVLAMLSAVALLSARVHDRYVETGLNVGVGASNSYFGVGDILTDTIVIDLNQIASDLGDNGLTFNLGANTSNFTNINFGPKFKLGFFLNTEAFGSSSIPKSFFELAAEGNSLNKNYTGDLNIMGDIFVEAGAYFGTRIAFLDVKFQPALFMPLLHIEDPTASYSFRTNSDGTMYADVTANVPIYSVVPLDGESDIVAGEAISNLVASSGLDFSGGASWDLFPRFLTVGARVKHLPLIPARLNNRTLMTASYTMNMDDLMNNIDDINAAITTTEDSDFVSDTNKIYVLRPFKLGVNAVFMPLRNEFISLEPNLDLGVYHNVYVDVGLKAKVDLFNILAVTLSSNYEDMIWKEQLALMLNLRIFELDFAVGSQSDNFVKSFAGAGLGASLGMKFGF